MAGVRQRGGRIRWRHGLVALAICVGAGQVGAQGVTAPRGDAPGAVWVLTYLKARPGAVDALAEAIRRNWFAMDARAVAAGHLESYRLLRGTPADSSWDLLEITTYRDARQHAQVDSLFRTIYRPQHTPVLVEGKRWQELGQIVRSETLHWVDGGPRPR